LVIRDNGQNYTEPEELRQLRDSLNNLGGSVDPQPIIKAAFDHEQVNSFCLRAVEMFISIWGAKAGDIALTYNAKAGVYIGGIPIPIVEQKKQNVFLESFKDKEGKFSNFNANIPVYIYKTDRIVLQGAARYLTIGHHITSGIIIVRRMIDQGE
jgi:glucokinase